jgi:hypothetical protein
MIKIKVNPPLKNEERHSRPYSVKLLNARNGRGKCFKAGYLNVPFNVNGNPWLFDTQSKIEKFQKL